jgi:hypothetical protein
MSIIELGESIPALTAHVRLERQTYTPLPNLEIFYDSEF